MDKKKKAVLDCLEDKAVSALLTTDLSSTCLHVLPMAKLTAKVQMWEECEIRERIGAGYSM